MKLYSSNIMIIFLSIILLFLEWNQMYLFLTALQQFSDTSVLLFYIYSNPSYFKQLTSPPSTKVIMQRCTHLLYCSVLSLGGNVNTRRLSKPDMGSTFYIKINEIFLSKETILCEFSKLSK